YAMSNRVTASNISNITIQGHGACTILQGTTAVGDGQSGYKGLLFVSGHTATTSHVVIKDLVIDANNLTETAALTLDGGSASAGLTDVTVKNVMLKNANVSASGAGALNIFSGTW